MFETSYYKLTIRCVIGCSKTYHLKKLTVLVLKEN